MQTFSPYTIQHLQLSEIDEILVPDQNHYFVFWCKEIPLGHLWFTKDEKIITQQEFLKNINRALETTISYYTGKDTGNGHPKLLQLLNSFAYHALHDQLNNLLTELNLEKKSFTNNRVSVVICTRNRSVALKRCLEALTKADNGNIEIIVVDNAPDDQSTKKVVADFSNVRYILEERKGLDIARNTGAQNAQYEIIAYTDDDVIVPPNWIETLKCCFSNPLTMAVTGMVIPIELQTEAQVIFERDWGFNKGYLQRVFDHRFFLDKLNYGVPAWDVGAGANMAFRRDAFLLAGWFDERLDVGASGCSGDSEMWYRIMAEGWNCHYFPNLYVYHQHRSSLEELKRQLFSYMRGHVSALLVQYENYQHQGNLNRLYKGFPKYFYYQIRNYLSNADKRKNASILTQIKGCISGWRFYQANKSKRRQDTFIFPDELKKDVNTDSETLVSVVIPCYNHGKYLKQAIESVMDQTHKNVEAVVVDDGSNDDTAIICADYNSRVKYVRVERVGLSAARNIGVQFSSGKFVVFLDADDYLYPQAIEINLFFFNYKKSSVFVSGAYTLTNEKGKPIPTKNTESKQSDNYQALLQGNYIAMEATVMYRRELFFYFHFDTQLKSCEDYDLNMKISRHFPVMGHDKVIAAYRQHDKNMSANRTLMKTNVLKVLQRQEKMLLNDEEKVAYQSGIKNWNEYYK